MKLKEWLFYIGTGMIAAICAGFLCLYLSGCTDKYSVTKKYYESGAIAEESYSVDKSVKIWSEGSGKTIEISPSVMGM